MAMQDKYNVGPVTLVQLVGLSAKPRIPSTQVDGAARAADHSPPSAAAGLGQQLEDPVSVIETSYFTAKTAPTLGLVADPLQSQISLEPGVDRPAPGSNATDAKFDPSVFDPLPPRGDLIDPAVDGRVEPPSNSEPIMPRANIADTALPNVTGVDPVVGSSVADLGYVFDGETTFGDDQILDFALAASDVLSAQAGTSDFALANFGVDGASQFDGDALDAWGMYDIIDCSGSHSPEPTRLSPDEFVAPQHQISATDAVPLI